MLCASAAFAREEVGESGARGQATHVVLVVWDGMRPEFVNETDTPHLWKLAQSGVTFRKHHSIYPTLTNVNAAALATGMNPGRSGIIANWVFRPELGTGKIVSTDAPETIAKGDQLNEGRYLRAATVAELVQARGGRTAIAGTKDAALLHARKPPSGDTSAARSVTLHRGKSSPPDALATVVKVIGKFPDADEVADQADAWTTRALTEVLWKDDVPEYSVLWLREPDRAQHASAPGSEAALAAIRATDVNFGLLLRALDEKKIRNSTDILVVSDHGFSTIERLIDVAELLRDAGFNVAGDKDLVLAPGQVRIAGNGGTNLYYVGDRDAETTARLIEFLQRTDFAGVIFSRQPAEGTFPLADAHIETADGPDVVMSFRWNDGRNAAGVPGHIAANGAGGKYKATHGTLSPFDVQNMFIAAGPDFRGGTTSELPTANTDVAATILHLLGITPPEPLDGRVVAEAMTDNTPHVPSVEAKTLEATRELPGGSWQQYLRASRVGSSVYLHEGNGQFLPPP